MLINETQIKLIFIIDELEMMTREPRHFTFTGNMWYVRLRCRLVLYASKLKVAIIL